MQHLGVEMPEMVLNIGCGSKKYSNCVNVDIRKDVRPEVRADLLHLPFKDGSFSHIIADDVIEHFTAKQVRLLLSECRRVLLSGGFITVKTPYFDAIIEAYKKRLFSDKEIVRRIFGGQDYPSNCHYQIYNPGMLIDLMVECGFPASNFAQDPQSPTNFILESQKQ